MVKGILIGLRFTGIVFVAHALMLLGADEVSSIEAGGVRVIRSLDRILTLYGADPKPLEMALPAWLSEPFVVLFSLPGWAVFGIVGGVLSFIARNSD
jgi:hypothetical protein